MIKELNRKELEQSLPLVWNEVANNSSAKEITVHSSIYAKDIYSKFGFIQNGDLCNDEGIQYIPMVYKNLI